MAETTERAGPSRATTSERVRWCLAVALAYYVLARLGLELSLVADSVTPLWPPTGIAVAAFVVLGAAGCGRRSPSAALAVNVQLSDGVLAAFATAAGNTLAPFAAALLLQRLFSAVSWTGSGTRSPSSWLP